MKRSIILGVALFLANLSFSQVEVGFKLGYTNSGRTNTEDSEFASSKRISGLHLGIVGQFQLTPKMAIALEIDLQQKGESQEISITSLGGQQTYDTKYTINYLEVPLLFRYTVGSETRIYLNAGPFVGYALGGKIKGESTVNGQTILADGNIKYGVAPDNYTGNDFYDNDTYNRLEVGIYLGGGILKELGVGSLILDARFGIGLTDTNDPDEIYPNGKPEGYISNRFNDIIISVGYLFPLGG